MMDTFLAWAGIALFCFGILGGAALVCLARRSGEVKGGDADAPSD